MASLTVLREAREQLGLTVMDLWVTYFSVGGNRDAAQLAAYLDNEEHDADPAEHDHIVDALNEIFVERGLDHPLRYGTR